MSLLEEYARKAWTTYGLQHQSWIRKLRNYIKTTPAEQLIEEINRITDINLFRMLWEAGLPSELQEAALRRYDELRLRRLVTG